MSYAQVNNGDGRVPATAEDITALVRTAVAELLDVRPETVGTDRPLRDLGLDSVRITSLMAALSERLGHPVPSWVVWQYPTIAGIAAHLAGDDAPPPSPRVPDPRAPPRTSPSPSSASAAGCPAASRRPRRSGRACATDSTRSAKSPPTAGTPRTGSTRTPGHPAG